MTFWQAFLALFKKHHDLVRRIEKAEDQTRQDKHKLRNLAMRTQAIHKLFSQMRDDELPQRMRDKGN
jgi:hypothetical protein